MAVRPIRITGDPVLHIPAVEVTAFDPTITTLVADMFETMDAAPGVGLAAPQVGVPLRIFTYGWTDDTGTLWRGVAINPELLITPLPVGKPDLENESEGCLSFPGERFGLRRAEHARLTASDTDGNRFTVETSGWLARIFQHEFDHLNGVLYIDRLGETDQKTAAKITRKQRWGMPGNRWFPGKDNLDL